MSLVRDAVPKPDIEQPRWDQSTYWNRAKHFFITTNPLNIFCSDKELENAKETVENYSYGLICNGTKFDADGFVNSFVDVPSLHGNGKYAANLTVDELWRAKQVYDSAFHPDTKEKMFLPGRMSAQVPANMVITGCMMTFYKKTSSVVFWQWFNQSFNAVVNYTNRNGSRPISVEQLAVSYCGATGGALVTALGLNRLVKTLPPIIGRFVPLCAVAMANCINIPLMRNRELQDGISLFDDNGRVLGNSKVAAKRAIAMVTISRILMAAPGMIVPPMIINSLEKKWLYRKFKFLSAPLQIAMVGFFLTFATPMCCAIFPQKTPIHVSDLEPELQKAIKQLPNPPTIAYYNKGL